MKPETFAFSGVAVRTCFRTTMHLRALIDWPRRTSFLKDNI